jgi:hypothetical protein
LAATHPGVETAAALVGIVSNRSSPAQEPSISAPFRLGVGTCAPKSRTSATDERRFAEAGLSRSRPSRHRRGAA